MTARSLSLFLYFFFHLFIIIFIYLLTNRVRRTSSPVAATLISHHYRGVGCNGSRHHKIYPVCGVCYVRARQAAHNLVFTRPRPFRKKFSRTASSTPHPLLHPAAPRASAINPRRDVRVRIQPAENEMIGIISCANDLAHTRTSCTRV